MNTQELKQIIEKRKYISTRIEALSIEELRNAVREKRYQNRCGESFDIDAKPESIARRAEAGLHWLRMQRLRARLRMQKAAREKAEAEAKALADIETMPALKAVAA